MMKSVLVVMIVSLLANASAKPFDVEENSNKNDQSDESKKMFEKIQTSYQKMALVAERTNFTYSSIYLRHTAEYVDKFAVYVYDHPLTIVENIDSFLDVYSALQKDMVDDFRVAITEKEGISSGELDKWLASWRSIKSVVLTCLLTLTDANTKPLVKIIYAGIEMTVIQTVAFVRDIRMIKNPLETIQAFVFVIAEYMMSMYF